MLPCPHCSGCCTCSSGRLLLLQLPRAALLLLQLGSKHPAAVLGALKLAVKLLPGALLAAAGDALVGARSSSSMCFYSSQLQQQQLIINFTHTPSGRSCC